MPSYLQKRRRRWYAVMEIPAALRPQFRGKVRLFKSLGTDSYTSAQRRIGPVLATWLAELDRALRSAKTEEQRRLILERIDEAADDIGHPHVDQGQAPSSSPLAQRFYGEATGAYVSTLEHLDEWLATSGTTAKTKDMHRSDVKRFAVKFPLLHDVQRVPVRRWVAGLMNDGGLAPKTVRRALSGLRGYWRWLQVEGVVPETEEPFSKLEVARQAKARTAAGLRQPFQPADVPKLIDGALARDDTALADLIRLAMWTGCRIEELCALKLADVTGDSFRVGAAKTAAGVRVVPVHDELQPVMARLLADSKDGYVLSGLSFNKYGDRSNGVGKRFGHMKTALGFGPQFVFHSLRKTVVTILENAGVSENVVADIVGHEKPRITYGLYSGGATLEVKRAALAKLAYPGAEPAALSPEPCGRSTAPSRASR